MLDTDKRLLFDAWKETVNVQMHFNDLELRIRNYAFVLTGAFLALGGYALREGDVVEIFGVKIAAASLVVLVAVIPVFAFRMMDLHWYHPLLMGAVKEGGKLETALTAAGIEISLGDNISKSSGMPRWILGEPRKLSDEDVENENYPTGSTIYEKDGANYARKFGRTWRSFRSEHKMRYFYRLLFFSLISASLALSVPLWVHGIEAEADDGVELG